MSQSTCFQLCDLAHPELQELMHGCSHMAKSNEQTGRESYIPDCRADDTSLLSMQHPCSCTDNGFAACAWWQGPA